MPASLPPPALPGSSEVGGLSLAPISAAARGVLRRIGPNRFQIGEGEPDEITIDSGPGYAERENGITVFTGGVVAKYGVTTIKAETLVIRRAPEAPPFERPPVTIDVEGRQVTLETEQGYAFGNVEILDPDGTVNATDLQFRWREGAREGTAQNVALRVGATRVTAARLVYTPEKTTLYDVFGTACGRSTPFLGAATSRATVFPGKRVSVSKPQIVLLGQRLPAIPTNLVFSLDRRTEGIQLPSLTYSQTRKEIGLSAGANRLLDPQTQLSANFAAYPNSRPRYGARYFHSTLSPDVPQGRLAPLSDLDERFFYSWFVDVFSGEPFSEVKYLRQNRSNYGVVSDFNAGASGRPRSRGAFSKLVEGVVEKGGPLGSGGYQMQLRASAFKEGREDFGPRVSLNTDYAQVLARQGRLGVVGRIDSNLVSGKGVYGYAGGEVGAFYQASPSIRFGGSAFAYAQGGDSGYSLDEIVYPRGFSLRTDLNSAPTKYSLLLRFDERGRQFDREYRISQVIGCLEPVIVYREYPHSYQIGLRFRIDDLAKLLQRRDPGKRSAKPNPFER